MEMDSDDKFWLTLWLAIIVAVAVVLVAAIGAGMYTTSLFVKGGYCEQPRIGSQNTMWAKCAEQH